MAVERGILPGGPDDPYPLPDVEVPIEDPAMDFSGGAEVSLDDEGGASVQALGDEEGVEVEAEVYEHTANLAEILDKKALTSVAAELLEDYKEDLLSRAPWEEV